VSCCCETESPYHRLLTALSGVLFIVGLVLSFQVTTESRPIYDTIPPTAGLTLLVAALVGGANFIPSGLRSLRSLSLDMDFLMTAALIAAAVIGEFAEAAAIGFLFSLSELAEDYAVDRNRSALDQLMALEPEVAERVCLDGNQTIPVEEIRVGDVLAVRPGGRLPVDGVVVSGQTSVDESTITGESLPADKTIDDPVYAGSMNQEGYVEVRAERVATQTLLNRIVQMVEDAKERKAPSEQFVRQFSRVYTPVVVALALIVMIGPWLLWGEAFGDWFTRGLAVLVIACPCALIISTPVAVISAITSASRNGVLIKGGDNLEAIADVRAIAFDKTGTLTKGSFEVLEVISANGLNERRILEIAGALESRSEHPIARAIAKYAGSVEPSSFQSRAGLGVEGEVDGIAYRVGRPSMLNGSLEDEASRLVDGLTGTAVVLSTDDEVLGAIVLEDAIRDEAADCLNALKRDQIRNVTILTGDRRMAAERVAEAVGVDVVEAGLLPEEKLTAIEAIQQKHGPVAMVGDGVNDAPALAAARVGVAMGVVGSDAALDTADAALMSDDLSKMPYLFRIARVSRRVIRQNIVASIVVKVILAAGAAGGVVSLAAAIVVGDIGMSLLVTGNALRLARTR